MTAARFRPHSRRLRDSNRSTAGGSRSDAEGELAAGCDVHRKTLKPRVLMTTPSVSRLWTTIRTVAICLNHAKLGIESDRRNAPREPYGSTRSIAVPESDVAFGHFGDVRDCPPGLVERLRLLGDPAREVRADVARALAGAGPAALPALEIILRARPAGVLQYLRASSRALLLWLRLARDRGTGGHRGQDGGTA